MIRRDDGASTELVPEESFTPLAVGCRECELANLDVVFVGYGATAPRHNYDDYAGQDVRGKAVIVLRKEPGPANPSSPFNGTRNTRHAFFHTKIDQAVKNGAAAILIVNDPSSIRDTADLTRTRLAVERKRLTELTQQLSRLPADDRSRTKLRQKQTGSQASVAVLQRELTQAQRGLMDVMAAGPNDSRQELLPVVSIARDVADQWLRQSSGRTLTDWQADIDRDFRPRSRPVTNLRLSIRIEILDGEIESKNILGVIDGRGGLADQTLVIGAHYDHVGMGGEGSLAPGTIAIHNGADDNASGAGALINIADRMVAGLASQPAHRRVVFIAFTGEERGLLGSKHYVRNPRFPIEQSVAMLNMDMIGRMRDNELSVYGTESAESFNEVIERFNNTGVLDQPFDLYKTASGFGPSDHNSFYEVGVPVLFFFTGLHSDYHRPGDDFDKLNLPDLNRVCDYVYAIATDLSTSAGRPRYLDTAKPIGGVRRQLTVFLGVSVRNTIAQLDANGQLMPGSDRLRLSAINERSPAESAGLRVDDVLLRFDDSEIHTLADLYDHLRKKNPGDPMSIDILRGGVTVSLRATLVPR